MKKCFWRCLPMVTGLLMAGNLAEGHSMKQVRAEISAGDGAWAGAVWLEAWALYPEDGPKIPPGTPGDPETAGRKWLKSLDAADHETMRKVAEEFLRETFVLTLDGKRLDAEFSFPDYVTSLPELPENDSGNALVKISLNGNIPLEMEGILALRWMDDEDEPLALEVKNPQPRLLRLTPKGEPTTLMEIRAGKAVAVTSGSSLWSWIHAGFIHILPKGLDHICFILGLFFLQPKWRTLLWQTSAFTVAHSITLALVVLGVFTIPSTVVEPMIALSIAYVGFENLWVKELKSWRVALVFGLGLLHGMGFASVMKELELPEGEVIQPLIGFNLGVESGQITVLVAAFLLTIGFLKKPVFATVRKIASGMIGVVGLYWTVERIWG